MSNLVFGDAYATAYDRLYGDKDYVSECELIVDAFSRYADGPLHSVLDLGCGSGGHALELASRGYDVVGVDRSEPMLALARAKVDTPSAAMTHFGVEFTQGDVRNFDLGRKFDAVVFMFAVLGYQLTNDDVLLALRRARAHLRTGGLLLFDIWYGPAVAAIGPGHRIKVVEEPTRTLIRVADGEVDERRGVCRVSYRLWDLPEGAGATESSETHEMRFFYPMELELLLADSGFKMRCLSAFPDLDTEADSSQWNALVVAT